MDTPNTDAILSEDSRNGSLAPMTERVISRQEYVADMAIHVAGIAFGVCAGIVLIATAVSIGEATSIVGVSIYTFCLVLMLVCSAMYNAVRPVQRTSWLRRLDHAGIFLMIAGSCTPFALQGEPGWRIVSLVALWTVALVAAGVKLFLTGRFDRAMIWAYLALGWGGAAILANVIVEMPTVPAVMLVVGGVLYSVGVIFHVWDSLRYQNAVWHAFVLAAAICHYVAIMGGVVLA